MQNNEEPTRIQGKHQILDVDGAILELGHSFSDGDGAEVALVRSDALGNLGNEHAGVGDLLGVGHFFWCELLFKEELGSGSGRFA